ncbi:dihydrodipicolinate synthase family protein [Halomonas sp. DP5Y7-2]|uniref:dihydrodipicolinate synthase family protein n=1 Tax=Halomonas sp. DP5Y7-2 TaxID=2859076 RepID=UPI001C99C0AA|nr:dihydrodipicolinate synthase family protein [Halomonas sp. DP5Y7-2]MBY5985627.1 dihydrodipicolinate synthase family protein [Halomonas sp. DP5Y7-2]
MNFDGIWVPIVTPFDDANRIDYPALTGLVDLLVEQGVHGLIVGGTTGEYYALDHAERLATISAVVDHLATLGQRSIPVIAGINSTTTDESLALGKAARDAGVDGILVAAPFYSHPTQDELRAHIERIDDAVDLPIMLYNFPDRTGVPMSLELLDALRARPNVQAIKESTGSIERLHALATEHADHLQLCCGMDDQVLEFFVWGARSWVCGAGNFLAPEHVALYRSCVEEKNFIAGRELATRLLPMLNLLEQGGKFCQSIKAGCELVGHPVGPTRAPLLALAEDERRELAAIIEMLRRHDR